MRIGIGLVVLWFALIFFGSAHAEPRASLPYRSILIREARAEWGLRAPIAVFAGQVEQESAWNPRACSAVACGLAQFTKPTAADMAKTLGSNADVFNPAWALRALVVYNHALYRATAAKDDCNHWAFTLSAYNGGLGNVRKDIELCRRVSGCTPSLWFGAVESYSGRSGSAFTENRGYPRAILGRRQFTYSTWGDIVSCSLPLHP